MNKNIERIKKDVEIISKRIEDNMNQLISWSDDDNAYPDFEKIKATSNMMKDGIAQLSQIKCELVVVMKIIDDQSKNIIRIMVPAEQRLYSKLSWQGKIVAKLAKWWN